MAKHSVLVMSVENRRDNAEKIQQTLTTHGCEVKARLGLHEAGNVCAEEGLIIIQLVPNDKDVDAFIKDINAIEGVNAKLVEL